MKIGDKLEIKGWSVGYLEEEGKEKSWKGEVKKAWREKNHQFFILRYNELGFTFMGVICSERYELFSLIANETEEWINQRFICGSILSSRSKTVTAITGKGENYIAFLFCIPNRGENIFYTIEGKKTIKEILEKAVGRFDEKKEKIRSELSLCFPNRF